MEVNVTWIFSVIAAVMLFLHGLAAFSAEVTSVGGEGLRRLLRRITKTDWHSALVGTFSTAAVQSSSAVTSMAVGLAHNKMLTERAAFAVMIGANVGTTLTAWLIALKITGIGPVFVALGGLWSLIGYRPWRAYGKAIFYFGLIFLALDLISTALVPLAHSPYLTDWHNLLESPALALLFGMLLTAILQSSSVTSGMAVLVVSQGLLDASVAVWMVAGANVGTTTTALLASSALDTIAKKLALLNTGFNVLGLLIFASLLQPLVTWALTLDLAASRQVALVHTIFNISAAIIALILLPAVWSPIERWLKRP